MRMNEVLGGVGGGDFGEGKRTERKGRVWTKFGLMDG